MSDMRFGIAGAGVIGQLRAAAIAGRAGGTVGAVFDVDESARTKLAKQYDAAQAASMEDLVSQSDLDAIVVSSPPQFHESQVIAALEAGKHVLCEKPLSNTLDSCATMVRAASDRGLTLTTGFNHRYFPAIKYIRDTLDQGLIGELDHIRAFAGHPGLSEFREPWEYDRKIVGGGALMDVGIHMIDLTHYLLG
ncbi:MAG: Gfo/Idh/MocA family oxidoreductase, partial [Rhodothermales bacterium]|nr:Gfo/Idh/MocA family oxidoreductase [Rhodothermales bacterium]